MAKKALNTSHEVLAKDFLASRRRSLLTNKKPAGWPCWRDLSIIREQIRQDHLVEISSDFSVLIKDATN